MKYPVKLWRNYLWQRVLLLLLEGLVPGPMLKEVVGVGAVWLLPDAVPTWKRLDELQDVVVEALAIMEEEVAEGVVKEDVVEVKAMALHLLLPNNNNKVYICSAIETAWGTRAELKKSKDDDLLLLSNNTNNSIYERESLNYLNCKARSFEKFYYTSSWRGGD